VYLVAGLGNPGLQYEETRHNVGFKTVDILAGQLNIDIAKKKFRTLIGEGIVNTEKVILIKPQTYMNLSGESIIEAIKWYKVPLSNLIIIYDDIDLPVGKIRIKSKGGPGTHNGMRSIVGYLGSEEFPRVRVGIGTPLIKEYALADYVLGRFSETEKPEILIGLKNAAEAVKMIIERDINISMNKYNR
jgi:PTH1 family peptidyl-tRNA hydrolase